jgi:hypothetical protein
MTMSHRTLARGFLLLAVLLAPHVVRAEVTIGGVATITHTAGSKALILNRMNRNDNAFNTLRLNLIGQATLSEHATLNLEYLIDEAALSSAALTYLRPWVKFTNVADRDWLNLQVGMLPLGFGTWGERSGTAANPVIGAPLMSGYHTSLRFDVLPLNGDSLWARRGRGQFGINYADPKGTGFKGMPTIYEACWDVGAELYGAYDILEYSTALTYGTPSVPMMTGQENNDEPGIQGRIGLSRLPGPLFGARFGVSALKGAFIPDGVPLPPGREAEDFDQIAYGFDGEYGLGPVVVRGEAVWNRWELPENTTPERWLPEHVDNTSYYVESKVTVAPGIFLGGRYDVMTFSEITSPSGTTDEWDADVTRYEVGAGWRPQRNWEVRYVYQDWHYPDYDNLDAQLYALQLRVGF